jgi:hypothetical protein
MAFETHPFTALGPLFRGSLALLTLVLAAGPAAAVDPATVRVRLHHRGDDVSPVTFVDIAVQGTDAPIRLMRRIEGTCALRREAVAPVLVRVECSPSVQFEVARNRDEVVVRRTVAPEAVARGSDGWMVIARAVLPPHTDVHVAPAGS